MRFCLDCETTFPYTDGTHTLRRCPSCDSHNIRLYKPTAASWAALRQPEDEHFPKDPFQRAVQSLKYIPDEQLQDLVLVITKLLEAREDERAGKMPDAAPDGDSTTQNATYMNGGGSKGSARGHIEAKIINGCGPYLYLRWWQGKRHRSFYLGKAPKTP